MESSAPKLTLSEFIAKNSPESLILKNILEAPRSTHSHEREFTPDFAEYLKGLGRVKEAEKRLITIPTQDRSSRGGSI